MNADARDRPDGTPEQRSESAAVAEAGLWTVPNIISLARLCGVPLFLWLVLGPRADFWALLVLIVAGLSDWLDGLIARAFNQFSKYGRILDPAADRLYILATLVALILRHVIPWWLVVLLVGRELFALAVQLVARRHGYDWLPVNFLGKTATLCLMYAFPLLFLGDQPGATGMIATSIGWAFAIWGTALYWWAGAMYAVQTRRLIAAARTAASRPGPEPGTGATSAGTRAAP